MSVRESEVRRIAQLARIEVDADEVHELTVELNGILEHMQVLSTLDLSAASDLSPQLRESRPSTRPAEAELVDELTLRPNVFAPRFEEGFFVVPPPPGLEDVGGDP